MIKLHIGQAKFSAIHPIKIVQLSAITELMGFKSVHVIYVAYSPKCITTALRAHTCKCQAAESYKQEILGRGAEKLLDLFSICF